MLIRFLHFNNTRGSYCKTINKVVLLEFYNKTLELYLNGKYLKYTKILEYLNYNLMKKMKSLFMKFQNEYNHYMKLLRFGNF